MRRKKKKQKNAGRICISLIVFVVTMILAAQIVHLYGVNKKYQQEAKTKQTELKEEQARTEELKERESYVSSDKYVVDTAKEKLGMTFPDEIVFKEK